MAKDREIQCIHYICEGQCDIGKDGTFRHSCQTCKNYKKKSGSRPARTDNRAHKLDKIQRKECY